MPAVLLFRESSSSIEATYGKPVTEVTAALNTGNAAAFTGAPTSPEFLLTVNRVTPGASGATATLTVTARSTVASLPGHSTAAQLALWLGTLPVFGVVLLSAGRRRKWQIAVLLVLVLVMAHVGCGGGGMIQTQSSSSPTSDSHAVVVTVTGTSGALQHSSAVTVTVPQ